MDLMRHYICKKCWKEWKVGSKALTCPYCGSKDIEYEYNITGE